MITLIFAAAAVSFRPVSYGECEHTNARTQQFKFTFLAATLVAHALMWVSVNNYGSYLVVIDVVAAAVVAIIFVVVVLVVVTVGPLGEVPRFRAQFHCL